MQDLRNIYRLHVIELENDQLNLFFDADLQYELFEDAEKEHSGYAWIDIIELFLEDNFPDLMGEFDYDPEADTCSLRGNFDEMKYFILEFRAMMFDDVQLSDYIERL